MDSGKCARIYDTSRFFVPRIEGAVDSYGRHVAGFYEEENKSVPSPIEELDGEPIETENLIEESREFILLMDDVSGLNSHIDFARRQLRREVNPHMHLSTSRGYIQSETVRKWLGIYYDTCKSYRDHMEALYGHLREDPGFPLPDVDRNESVWLREKENARLGSDKHGKDILPELTTELERCLEALDG